MSSEDRPPGILTRGDRAYFRGEKEYEQQEGEINKRRAIRRRILHGLLDFYPIEKHVLADEKSKIFEAAEQECEGGRPGFVKTMEMMVGWVYSGLKNQGYDAVSIFENGIASGENNSRTHATGMVLRTNVNIIVERQDLDGPREIIKNLESGKPVSSRDIFNLVRNDVLVDLSDLDEIRVVPVSSDAESERSMIEAAVSEFFDQDVEVILVRD